MTSSLSTSAEGGASALKDTAVTAAHNSTVADRQKNTPAKILYVIDHFKNPNAGTEGQLYQLLKHLDRTLFKPELLVFSSSPWLDNAVSSEQFPCPVRVLGSRSLSSPKTWWRLWQQARQYRRAGGRIAHVFFNDPSIICPPVFKLCGLKTLISRRDMGYWYTPLLQRLLRITRHACTGVVVNSQAVADITCATEGFSASNSHVIYNGYESSAVTESVIPELALLKQQGRMLVGLVANIRPIKRIDDMVQALALINDTAPQLDFVHIGDGEQSLLTDLAAQLGIAERVHCLGPRTDIKACLQYFDLAALCSESEGFSNALIEYLQAGLPVVCSRVGGNPEAVQNNFNGFLYEFGDVKILAEKLALLANDEALRLRMSVNGKQQANERYTVAAMINAHQQLYSKL